MKKIITMVVFIFISSLLIAEEVESVENVIPQEVIESNVINFKFDSIKINMSTKEFLRLYPKATKVEGEPEVDTCFYKVSTKSCKDVSVASYNGKIYAIIVNYSPTEIERLGGSTYIGFQLVQRFGPDRQTSLTEEGDIAFVYYFNEIQYTLAYTFNVGELAVLIVRNDKVYEEVQNELRKSASLGF